MKNAIYPSDLSECEVSLVTDPIPGPYPKDPIEVYPDRRS